MILAAKDELTIAEPAREDAEALCEQGYAIELIECADADHVDGAIDTITTQIAWANQRATGVPLDDHVSCALPDPVDCATLESEH